MKRPFDWRRALFPTAGLLCILFTQLTCSGQTTAVQPPKPEPAKPVFQVQDPAKQGFDASKLTALDELFAADVKDGRIAGCVALVFRDSDVVYCKTFGNSNQADEKQMTEDSIFRIYSMSKPVTSVAVMMLVEDGKIDLDAPVSKYLPEFAELKVLGKACDAEDGEATEVDLKRPMLVRDLMRHTSGLTYGFFGNTEIDKRYRRAGILSTNPTLADMVTKLSKIPLLHQPGERFHYSVSTDVLGRVVEVASKKSFADFLDQRIFKPLKMVDTGFTLPKDKHDRLAEMYRVGREKKLVASNRLESWRFLTPNKFYSGGGGLCSTTADYLRFARMLANSGSLDGVTILKPETLKEMTKNQLPGGSRFFQFGLGVRIDSQGRYGWGGAAGTRFWVDPKQKIVGLFMVQLKPYRGPDYEGQMKRIVYDALKK